MILEIYQHYYFQSIKPPSPHVNQTHLEKLQHEPHVEDYSEEEKQVDDNECQ